MNEKARPSGRLERAVRWCLISGLAVSSAFLLAGLVVVLTRHVHANQSPPARLSVLLRAAARGEGVSLLDLGLLALVATPIMRVAVLAVGWTLAGDRRFAAIAIVVLTLLGLGLALGLG